MHVEKGLMREILIQINDVKQVQILYAATHKIRLTPRKKSVKSESVAVHKTLLQAALAPCFIGSKQHFPYFYRFRRSPMFAIPEQFSNATKSAFEAQFALYSALSAQTFDSVEKLVALNLSTAKNSLAESTATARALLAVKDPQEFISLTTGKVQPAAEKALAYGREVTAIVRGTGAEFSKVAESQMIETNRKVLSLVDEVTKNAPAGSEQFVSAMKTAIGNASAGYEHISKTAKQAAETMENNVNTAVSQFASKIPTAA
jgi:phasin family protein